MPRPILTPVRTVQHTLIGYPDPVPNSTLIRAPESGLDALSRAYWTPENTRSEMVSAQQWETVGLSALRFAIWDLEGEGRGEKRKEKKHVEEFEERYMSFTKDLTPQGGQASPSYACTTIPSGGDSDMTSFLVGVSSSSSSSSSSDDDSQSACSESSESESSNSESESQKKDEEQEVDEEDEDMEDTSDLSFVNSSRSYGESVDCETLPARPDGHNPYVMALQEELQKAYPDLNDLSTRSENGFQPHLTLGQCSISYSRTFMEELKKTFKEFTFEVKSVELISRSGGFCDPFKVKMSVPLGGIAHTMGH